MSHAEPLRKDPSRAGIDWRAVAASPWSIAIAAALVMGATLAVSLQRTVLGVAVESDYTGTFAREAQRILLGEPLLLPNHPPGYPFVVALWQMMTGDWLASGLWISGLSTLAVIAASILLFRRLCGTTASWGALLALACSTSFLTHASLASSDMFFVALLYGLLLLVVQVLATPDRVLLWAASGAVAACVLLTRTNGLAAAVVLLLPFIVPRDAARRGRNLAAVAAGFLAPLAAWVLYATATDSVLTAGGTHINLAVAAYGEEYGSWSEQSRYMRAKFQDLPSVLAYDPAQFVQRLATNLAKLPYRAVTKLTWLPIGLLAIPGLILMLRRRPSPAFLVCLLILAGASAIPGILGFHARFHLTLVPLLGALAGVAVAFVLDRLAGRPRLGTLVAAVALVATAATAARTATQILPRVEAQVQREFAEAIPILKLHLEPEATLIARNPNLSFETGRHSHSFPDVAEVALLREALCRDLGEAPVYLFIGDQERRNRPQLTEALETQGASWLEPVAQGTATHWSLFRIRLDHSSAESCSSSSAT